MLVDILRDKEKKNIIISDRIRQGKRDKKKVKISIRYLKFINVKKLVIYKIYLITFGQGVG